MSYIAKLNLIPASDSSQSDDAVIKRLQRMKENLKEKETQMRIDPFKRTFLERTREYLSCGFPTRQNSLKIKLNWFAGSEWCQREVEPMLHEALKASKKRTISSETGELVSDSSWVPMFFENNDLSFVPVLDNNMPSVSQILDCAHGSDPAQLPAFAALVGDQGQSISELFLFTQKYSLERSALLDLQPAESAPIDMTPGDADVLCPPAAEPPLVAEHLRKMIDEQIDGLDMIFSAEDLSLFAAAVEGVHLKYA